MRSFTHLIREHNIAAIFINSVINNQSGSNITSMIEQTTVPASTSWTQDPQDAIHTTTYPSIFMSNTLKPALVKQAFAAVRKIEQPPLERGRTDVGYQYFHEDLLLT